MDENSETIEAAARAIEARSQDDLHVSAPADWHEVDIQGPQHVIVRLIPASSSTARVQVFDRDALLANEVLRDYTSATELANLVEDVLDRARGLTPDPRRPPARSRRSR
jgi:hypothetical protein